MQKLKFILSLLLTLSLSLALFACGGGGDTCTAHTDKDGDGKCDTCGKTVEDENNGNNNTGGSEIALIAGGKINFQFVNASTVGGGVMMALNELKSAVEALGGTLNIASDKADTLQDIEVLVGDVTTRGDEYKYDKYSLGEKGYIIKAVGNKVIVNAGSTDTLVDAVEIFIKDILGIKMKNGKIDAIKDATMTSEKDIVEIQDGYRITSIKINDVDIKGYTIAYDFTSQKHQAAAANLNKFLYSNAGYYLPLVKLEEAGKSIIIEAVDYAGEEGFLVKTDASGALRIQCAYDNSFDAAFTKFFSTEFRLKTGDINFGASYKYTDEISVVYYDDYMHLSVDGNDYPALKAAHDFANQGGQLVKAGRGKSYTITSLTSDGENYSPIYIQTNVDFGNAKILIDDTYLESHLDKSNKDVFVIRPSRSEFALSYAEVTEMFPDGIDAETLTKIDWKYDFSALLVVKNSERKVYRRYGDADYNDGPPEERGSAQSELIVIDKDGNIDPETFFMFDYTKVTGVSVYPIDETPLTITGGIFTTKASHYVHKVNGAYKVDALHRGFCSQRSNVTFKGCEYYVTNEVTAAPNDPDNKGAGYDGFFRVQLASDVTFEECVLTARRYYYVRGSYALNAHTANRVVMKNCTQSNFYFTDQYGNKQLSMYQNWYWGVCGTAGCKNLIYDGSTLSRFDSHTNLQHGKIINSTITGIQLIGGGDFIIENTTIIPVSNVFVNLRQDYGATWKGDITIKDCKVELAASSTEFNVVYMPWVNYDFGYASYMPNLTVDNLRLSRDIPINLFKSTGGHYANKDTLVTGEVNVNKLNIASYIIVKNNYAKHLFRLDNLEYYNDIEISRDTITIG